jgi:hypothetical protein
MRIAVDQELCCRAGTCVVLAPEDHHAVLVAILVSDV